MNVQPFKTIGIGVAFSPNLKANIYEASRLAGYFDATLVLIHVGQETPEKREEIDRLMQGCQGSSTPYYLEFRSGDPVAVILEVAAKQKVDLLILGAIQREGLLRYYVGSIARKITRKATCSVLLLINPSVERIACRHIVVNGLEDPKTQQTISTSFYVAQKLGVTKISIAEEIRQQEIAVQVNDHVSLRKANIIKDRLRLREGSRIKKIVEDLPTSLTADIEVHSQPIFGTRGYSIGHYAQVVRADLLVMNAPSELSFWDRFFPHDIEHILSELPTDVLIIQ
ncbi:MAG: universal stress protein [Gilvibacter sp.]